MTIDFTVVIPTYNSENRISLVLDKLQQQNFSKNIAWEILVIDNNSLEIISVSNHKPSTQI